MKRTWSQANASEYGQLGIIESVKLRNFMCHDNLSFDFDPHMNFIIGRNGSGKSAILTGIILALGGKSSSTGRFYNIKGFVKTGKNTALISVTLKNCGPDAYKPDVYGEKITIERQFTLEGANNYKLKSESGKIISSSKEELTNVLNVMDIQIENPVTVLVQDTSKNFLVSKTSKGEKLFKLFYEGTGLSRVYDDYNRAMQQSQEAQSELKIKKAVLVDMEKDVKSLKTLLNKSAKINELKKELMWSIVIKFENERDAAVENFEQLRIAVSDKKLKIDHCTEQLAEISHSIQDAESERKESRDKMANLRARINEKQSEKSTLKSEIREIEGTLKRHKREFERILSVMLGLEEQMDQAKMQNQNDFNAERVKHENIVKTLREKVAEVCSSIRVYSSQETDLNNKVLNQQKNISSCHAEMQELSFEKERILKQKSQITSGLKNRINFYGMEMVNVLKDISNSCVAGKFKVKPVGPIEKKKKRENLSGLKSTNLLAKERMSSKNDYHSDCQHNQGKNKAKRKVISLETKTMILKRIAGGEVSTALGLHFDVKDPKWSFAIQECLNFSFLKSFICDNNEDGEELSKIFSKYYQQHRPSILISKFVPQVYDVSAHKCVCSYPTVLDMLNIKVPVVANTLIDQKQIENILLVESPTEARNLVLKNRPDKCLYVYSCNGDQFCHSPIRIYSCRNKNKLCMFSIQKVDLERIEEEIKKLDIIMAEKRKSKEVLLHDLNILKEQMNDCREKIMKLKLEESELNMKLTNEESSYVDLRDINSLQTEWDIYKQNKENLESKLNACQAVLEDKTRKLDDLDQQLEESSRILQMENTNFSELSKKVEEYQSQKEKLHFACEKFKREIIKPQQDLEDKEQLVANCNATLKLSTEQTLKVCDRIDTERSPDTLRSLIAEIRNHLEKQKNIDREKLIQEYEEKVTNFNKAKSELHRQEKINDRLVNMITERFQEFKKICKNTSVALTCAFTTLLRDNRFTGFPDVNFETKTLDIYAKPENSKSKFGKKPNLSQLSGGERSYVTIAFLLALWDRIHSPFRILDEYDVFMDPNNRHRSINLLINNARSNKKIQYIFLSPLELPHIAKSDHVKVHKMPDPRD